MLSAIIMLNVEYGQLSALAERLASEPGISEAYTVAGKYDLILHARVQNNESLAELVTERIAKLQGIRSCETMVAFRVYSSRTLDAGFAIGENLP
jgi:DNA-binding Lrp family transcriptional regulator